MLSQWKVSECNQIFLCISNKYLFIHESSRIWCSSCTNRFRPLHNHKTLFKNPQCPCFFTHVVLCAWRIFQHQGIPLISAVINQAWSWRRRNCWWEYSFLFPVCPKALWQSAHIEDVLHRLSLQPAVSKTVSAQINIWQRLFSCSEAFELPKNKQMMDCWKQLFFVYAWENQLPYWRRRKRPFRFAWIKKSNNLAPCLNRKNFSLTIRSHKPFSFWLRCFMSLVFSVFWSASSFKKEIASLTLTCL